MKHALIVQSAPISAVRLLSRVYGIYVETLKTNSVHRKEITTLKQGERVFSVGDTVFVIDFARGDKWLSGTIAKVLGTRSFEIALSDGSTVRRHLDHVRKRDSVEELPSDPDESVDFEFFSLPSAVPTNRPTTPSPEKVLRRSTRDRRPPA